MSDGSLIDYIDAAIEDYRNYKVQYPDKYFCLSDVELNKWLKELRRLAKERT